MNQTGTVERRVLEIMRACPRSRYDDMVLVSHYYNLYGFQPIGNLPCQYVLFNYKRFGLPCFETIRRARQRVQALFPELSRTPPRQDTGGILVTVRIGG